MRAKSHPLPAFLDGTDETRRLALRYLLEAWEEAVIDGVDAENLANAAIFAALTDMVAVYGEEPVARMAESLPERIRHGEFTMHRTTQ